MVAERAEHRGAPPKIVQVRSDGRDVRLRQGVQESLSERRDQGSACLDDGFTALVACRLRSLWWFVHPHGGAQRGPLPPPRRPLRRRCGPAAFRAAELLAGQREPRQGTPAVVADQAEIRPENL